MISPLFSKTWSKSLHKILKPSNSFPIWRLVSKDTNQGLKMTQNIIYFHFMHKFAYNNYLISNLLRFIHGNIFLSNFWHIRIAASKNHLRITPFVTVYILGQKALNGCCLLCWTSLNTETKNWKECEPSLMYRLAMPSAWLSPLL